MQFARVTDHAVGDHQLGTAAGVPRRLLSSPHRQHHTRRRRHDARRLDGVTPRGRLAGPPPTGRLTLSGQGHGHVPGLLRHRRQQGPGLLVVRPAVDAQQRRCRLLARQEHQPEFEQRHIALAPGAVAHQRLEQPGQQRRTHGRFLLRDRVGEARGAPARIRGVEAEKVEDAGVEERVRRGLDVPGLGQRPPDRPPAALADRQPATGRCQRQDGRNGVVPVHPGDLLAEVGRVGQVGAPRRREYGQAGAALHGTADVGQRTGDRLGPIRHTGDPGGQVRVEQDRLAGHPVVDIQHP